MPFETKKSSATIFRDLSITHDRVIKQRSISVELQF